MKAVIFNVLMVASFAWAVHLAYTLDGPYQVLGRVVEFIGIAVICGLSVLSEQLKERL